MENETFYKLDILVKIESFNLKKQKNTSIVFSILTGLMSLLFITLDVLGLTETLLVGLMFLILFIQYFAFLIRVSNKSIIERINKVLYDDPNKVVKYKFRDDYFSAIIKSDNTYSTNDVKYSFISKVVKIDDKLFYILRKDNFYYPIYDENGIDELIKYVKSKTNNV